MQLPTNGPVGRAIRWVWVPLFHPEYRRLVIHSFLLSVRLELLCAMFALVSPFASPRLLLLLRHWFENLRADVAEFGRTVRARPGMATSMAADAAVGASVGVSNAGNEFQNPWL